MRGNVGNGARSDKTASAAADGFPCIVQISTRTEGMFGASSCHSSVAVEACRQAQMATVDASAAKGRHYGPKIAIRLVDRFLKRFVLQACIINVDAHRDRQIKLDRL